MKPRLARSKTTLRVAGLDCADELATLEQLFRPMKAEREALFQDESVTVKVAEAVAVGRRAERVIQFNVGFVLALKAVFLIRAVVGHASLWLAILADTGATLLVIANAMRLLRTPAAR